MVTPSQPPAPSGTGFVPPPLAAGPSRRIGPVKRLVFSLVATLAVVGVVELVLRLTLAPTPYLELRVYADRPGDLAPSQAAPVTLAPESPATPGDPGTEAQGLRFTMTSTPEGFRSPSQRVDDPRVRILCLGDSSMMGYLVPDWETFPAQLSARLEDSLGPWVEVLNAAAIGYTIDDELEYMEAKGLALRPSLVVLEIFPNDVLEKATRPKTTLRSASRVRWPLSGIGPSLDNWGLVRAGRRLAAKFLPPPVPAEPVERVDEILEPGRAVALFDAYEKTLRELDALLTQHHIPLILLLTPHHYQVCPWGEYADSDAYQGQMLRMGEGMKAQWIDLLPAFRERIRTQPDLYITNGLYDMHETGAGQRLKLDAAWPAILESLERQGAVSLGRRWSDTPPGERRSPEPSLRWGRTWTGQNDAPGIEVRPPAKARFAPQPLPAQSEFRCELVGGPYGDQCRAWLSTDDGATTRVVELPVVGPGEVRVFIQPITAEGPSTARFELLAAWAEGFRPEERADLRHSPLVLRRPVFLPRPLRGPQSDRSPDSPK